jgi:hypothetical protein
VVVLIDNLQFDQHFTLPNPNILANVTSGTVPFHFSNRHSNNLLVTLGDSWSWGRDLTAENNTNYRLKNVYGNQLAEKLSADFLNLAVSGSGNQYIQVLFNEFCQLAPALKYENIYVVVVFTEIGRDFNGWFDQKIDYRAWLDQNIRCSESYTEFLQWQNDQLCCRMLSAVAGIQNLHLVVGTNFVDPIGLELLHPYQLPKTWLEVYAEANKEIQHPSDPCYFVSPYILDKYKTVHDIHWDLNPVLFLEWANKRMDQMDKRLNILSDTKYFRDLHPLVQGHSIWADYVYEHINQTMNKSCPQ